VQDMPKICSNPLYKYNYLIAGLRKKIIDNKFGPAGKLPAERMLSEMYEVSRVTVRTALKQLKAENLIEQQQGRGTFVKLQYTKASYDNDYNIARKEVFKAKFIVRHTSDIIDADPYFGQILLGFYRSESDKYKYSISNINIGMDSKLDEYLENNPKALDQCDGFVISCSLTDSEIDQDENNVCKME
jgi:DNA-binding transcriptional regulator YhcF (GntR family)